MATHSRILAWKIPWTEESGGLWSMGSQSQTHLNTTHKSFIPEVQCKASLSNWIELN